MKAMRITLAIAVVFFTVAAVCQLFLLRRLPNALVYCGCVWLLVKTRRSI